MQQLTPVAAPRPMKLLPTCKSTFWTVKLSTRTICSLFTMIIRVLRKIDLKFEKKNLEIINRDEFKKWYIIGICQKRRIWQRRPDRNNGQSRVDSFIVVQIVVRIVGKRSESERQRTYAFLVFHFSSSCLYFYTHVVMIDNNAGTNTFITAAKTIVFIFDPSVVKHSKF